ncbi:MAG: DUF2971 domain-containing protein [Crocinitomicaceae bacterium]|nr:DUF2971 domain-containing protein [Crocinitomicaceae bacterium]
MITLYKYSRIDKNLIHGLSCKTNWISDPKSFNDPFEFVSRAEYDHTESGISRHSFEDIRYKKFIESTAERYGVVSYSELDTNNALMWSHYADHHKGICLIFEINEKENPDLYKVKYKKILPKLDYTKSESAFRKNLVNIATTKSVDWKYEKEWREVFTFKNRSIAYPGKLSVSCLVVVALLMTCELFGISLCHYMKKKSNSQRYLGKKEHFNYRV